MNNDFHENRAIYELFDGLAVAELSTPVLVKAVPVINGSKEAVRDPAESQALNGNGNGNGQPQPLPLN